MGEMQLVKDYFSKTDPNLVYLKCRDYKHCKARGKYLINESIITVNPVCTMPLDKHNFVLEISIHNKIKAGTISKEDLTDYSSQNAYFKYILFQDPTIKYNKAIVDFHNRFKINPSLKSNDFSLIKTNLSRQLIVNGLLRISLTT
jgi:hypothetical protein